MAASATSGDITPAAAAASALGWASPTPPPWYWSRRTSELVDGLRAGHGVVGQLLVDNELARDVNDIAINLSVASETIADHPESLIFGTDTRQLAALQARRERMRLRRAFSEGYYRTPPVQVVEPLRVELSPPRPPAQVDERAHR